MRERLNCVALRARPAEIRLRGTIDGTIDRNDGMDKASVMPTISDIATTIQGCTVPARRRPTINRGQSIWIDWKRAITRRRSARSASTPPAIVSSHTGAPSAKLSRPTTKEEALRLSSSQGCATCCAQVPMFDSRLAKQNVPKRLVRRSRSDSSKAGDAMTPEASTAIRPSPQSAGAAAIANERKPSYGCAQRASQSGRHGAWRRRSFVAARRERRIRLGDRRADEQHRHRSHADDLLGVASYDKAPDPTTTVRSDDDEIGIPPFRLVDDDVADATAEVLEEERRRVDAACLHARLRLAEDLLRSEERRV